MWAMKVGRRARRRVRTTRCVSYEGICDGGAEGVWVWQEEARCEPTLQWEEGREETIKKDGEGSQRRRASKQGQAGSWSRTVV